MAALPPWWATLDPSGAEEGDEAPLPPHVVVVESQPEPQFKGKPTLVLPIAAISDPDSAGPSVIGGARAQRSRGSSAIFSDWERPSHRGRGTKESRWSRASVTGKAVVFAWTDFGRYWFNPTRADRSYMMDRLRAVLEKLPDLLPPSPLNRHRLRAQMQGTSPLASPRASQEASNRVSAFSYVSFQSDAGEPMTPQMSLRNVFVQELSDLCKMGLGRQRVRDVESVLKPRTSVDSFELLRESHLDDFTIEQLREGFQKVLSTDGVGTVEQAMTRHRPFFIIMNVLFTAILWLVHAECIWCRVSTGGLENVFPGKTLLRVHDGCEDLRAEVWRWITYQFTHVSITHVLVNLLLTLIAGVPLEGMHGTSRMALMFNLGVLGGACCAVLWDVHSATAGMSGGLYALMGMHLADLIMNWQHKVYRYPILVVLVSMFSTDVIGYVLTINGNAKAATVSHAAHFGGYLTGICAGILFGMRLCPRRCDYYIRAAACSFIGASAAFATLWALQWPPRSVWEADGWCAPPAF